MWLSSGQQCLVIENYYHWHKVTVEEEKKEHFPFAVEHSVITTDLRAIMLLEHFREKNTSSRRCLVESFNSNAVGEGKSWQVWW